ncbi:unnamed protein product [Amoebophrya sp. A120]|nr:unnamed protein product [Amoebophrya sp. A120]|eukprot:GSA120T00023742001.1
MGKFFDLTSMKLTRAQGAHALELLNQNIKLLALTPRSIKQLEQLAKTLLKAADGESSAPDAVLDNFDLTSLRLSSAQCFKTCQLFLDNADVLELDVDQASVVDEFSQEFANAESEIESQEEEEEVFERHIDDLQCVVCNDDRKKLCRLYLIGECPFQDLCPLRHPPTEELDKVYSYYASLPCRNGDRCKLKNCLYQHPGGPVKGSIQDQYIRRVVKGGRSTICFRFLTGCCDQTAEQCDKVHANADEALKTIQKCRASTCKNGPECRVAGCLFNHSGYPVWYVPKSKDSIWWGRGWDEELENEKKEIQFYYEGKLREAADYYESKLQELDDWHAARRVRMENDIMALEQQNAEKDRQVAAAAAAASTAVVQQQPTSGSNMGPPAGSGTKVVYHVDKNGQKSQVMYSGNTSAQKGGNPYEHRDIASVNKISREEWGDTGRDDDRDNYNRGGNNRGGGRDDRGSRNAGPPAEYNNTTRGGSSANLKPKAGGPPKEFLKPQRGGNDRDRSRDRSRGRDDRDRGDRNPPRGGGGGNNNKRGDDNYRGGRNVKSTIGTREIPSADEDSEDEIEFVDRNQKKRRNEMQFQ